MQIIRYIFSDGTTSEVEVSDEFFILHLQLQQQEKRNHWKETRRHISLENLNENGIDFASPAAAVIIASRRNYAFKISDANMNIKKFLDKTLSIKINKP